MDKIIITGGGTGGHLFPALSIGDSLEKKGFSIIYIGSKFGIENQYFKKSKIKYYLLNIKGIHRNLSIKSIISNILLPIRCLISYFLSIKIIRKHKPVAIIGTGGYASALPLIAGYHLKIPLMIQEQNSIPGIITKLMSKRVENIFLGYDILGNKHNNVNSIYTGNPIRKDLKLLDKKNSKDKLNFNKNKKLILIIGGSQGSYPINNYIKDNIDFFIKNDFQLLWQVGKHSYETMKNINNNETIKIEKFINNMSEAYSAADLVISRAGAIAISELTLFNKAMILVPFPGAANNHQNINAEYLYKKGACIIVNQSNLKNGHLEKSILNLFSNNDTIKLLEKQSKLLCMPNATEEITKKIIKSIK